MDRFLSLRDYYEIQRAVFDAIHRAFRKPAQSEPELVANLVWELPIAINRLLLGDETDRKNKIKISAGGVFVHSRPLVQCKNFPQKKPKSVEIGDLLLVQKTILNGKVQDQRALLMQAKKIKKLPARPDKNNPNQWHLYANWPPFTYAESSGSLTGLARDLSNTHMCNAAKYLLIGDQHTLKYLDRLHCPLCFECGPNFTPYCEVLDYYPYHYLMGGILTAVPWQKTFSHYNHCFTELVNFIVSRAGKPFKKPKPGDKGWDQVIEDLITTPANLTSIYCGHAASVDDKGPRGNLSHFLKDHSIFAEKGEIKVADFNDGPPRNIEPWPEGSNGENAGISRMEIIVSIGGD